MNRKHNRIKGVEIINVGTLSQKNEKLRIIYFINSKNALKTSENILFSQNSFSKWNILSVHAVNTITVNLFIDKRDRFKIKE